MSYLWRFQTYTRDFGCGGTDWWVWVYFHEVGGGRIPHDPERAWLLDAPGYNARERGDLDPWDLEVVEDTVGSIQKAVIGFAEDPNAPADPPWELGWMDLHDWTQIGSDPIFLARWEPYRCLRDEAWYEFDRVRSVEPLGVLPINVDKLTSRSARTPIKTSEIPKSLRTIRTVSIGSEDGVTDLKRRVAQLETLIAQTSCGNCQTALLNERKDKSASRRRSH